MKKLLSLLSVLTISGSAIPTTIAASPYQKQENLNSNINLQTNNLENLSRVKRDNNIEIKESGILRTTKKIISPNNLDNFNNLKRSKYNYKNINGIKSFTKKVGADPLSGERLFAPVLDSYFDQNNLPVRNSFASLNNNFYFITNSGKIYEYKTTPKEQNINVIFSSSSEKAIICVIHLKNSIFFATTDGNIYEYNILTKRMKKIFNTNNSIYSIHSDLENNKIYFGVNNGNFYEYWSYEELNDDNIMNLLKEWKNDYNKLENEVNRQIKEDVPTFTEAQKRTWKDDKNFQLRIQISLLKDKLSIIKNHDEINKINDIILNLKNEINKIYEDIDLLNTRINKIKEELDKNPSKICESNELMGDVNDSFSLIPVFSTITGSLKSITTISCKIFKL
ncbi:coiled-coil domain-containing protein [Spiroplasma endosymbiont of Megaselia nigra]|uniref:hypothetical protein n=1 Tax=Spiroplasma endosymbiont of Megaselia nigra TaxID=2478537 RepID=UPI000F880FF5|nr:hypothetical protein [Spiroplasma endosymbiont of Megaselia nigra]RUO86125.1 hypothetical protein D9R21_04905 [Spiroplasma endosymbiont of Megaselia nigra]